MRRSIILPMLFSIIIAQDYQSEIQPIWDNSCTASCHNSGNNSGGLNLTPANSYSEMVNVASQAYSGFLRVKPNDPANSALYQKIVGNTAFGDRMPKGGANLSQADEEKIKKWIEEGAPQSWNVGGSYDFEQGDEVEVSASELNGSSHFSMEFFVMFHTEPNEEQVIIERESNDGTYHDFFFDYNHTNKEFVLTIDQVGTLTYPESNLMGGGLNNSGWHHVYFEYNNQDLNFFWDGNNVASVQNIPNLIFPTSSNQFMFEKFKGSIDGVRFRNASGFEGIPGGIWDQTNMGNDAILVWNCNEILVDASINPNHSNQYLKDESDKNNHGLIEGNGQLDGDVFGGSGGGNQIIDLTIGSLESLSGGETRVGLIPAGKDPNYWSSRSWDWTFGAFTFPGSYPTSVWNNDIPDGNDYHIIVFYDENNDWNLDDANEAYGISASFNIQGSYGNAGPINMTKGGGGGHTLTVDVEMNQDYPFGQVWFGVWEEGQNPAITQPIHEHQVGEDPGPPFPFIRSYGLNWTLQDGKNYFIGGFFDLNNNKSPDPGEPQGMTPQFNWPVSQSIKLVFEDMTGPEIQINDLIGLSANEGEDLEIIVNIMSTHSVQQAKIEYYVSGSSQISTVSMSNSGGDSWRGTIPGSEVNAGGLLVEVVAEDSRGMDSFSGIHEVQIDFQELHLTHSPGGQYIMISAPGLLQNTSLSAVLDELGERDPTLWRQFRWTGSGYTENSGSFTPGSAYWLITKESETILAGNGKSTALINPPSINLSQGWNMIGNPFAFSISLTNSKVEFEGDIEEQLHRYNGSGYSPTTNLQPGEGYWIHANTSGRITFDFLTDISGSHNEPNDETDELNQFNWIANISAGIGNKQDNHNSFGTHPNGNDEWDQLDRREPPVIGDYISVAFDNENWSDRKGRYSQDIRSEDSQVQSWILSAKTNIKGIVSLKLDDMNQIPAYQDIRLVDRALGLTHDLRSVNEVTFTSQGTENPYYFELLVGPPDDIQDQLAHMGMVPQSFELAQNTPNPFNPVTNIRVSLIEDANITLKVYNLLGEELNAIAVDQSFGKGNHRFIWAGKDGHGHQLPSGIYLYRLEVISHGGNHLYQDTKKMVLMK